MARFNGLTRGWEKRRKEQAEEQRKAAQMAQLRAAGAVVVADAGWAAIIDEELRQEQVAAARNAMLQQDAMVQQYREEMRMRAGRARYHAELSDFPQALPPQDTSGLVNIPHVTSLPITSYAGAAQWMPSYTYTTLEGMSLSGGMAAPPPPVWEDYNI